MEKIDNKKQSLLTIDRCDRLSIDIEAHRLMGFRTSEWHPVVCKFGAFEITHTHTHTHTHTEIAADQSASRYRWPPSFLKYANGVGIRTFSFYFLSFASSVSYRFSFVMAPILFRFPLTRSTYRVLFFLSSGL